MIQYLTAILILFVFAEVEDEFHSFKGCSFIIVILCVEYFEGGDDAFFLKASSYGLVDLFL